MVTKNWPMKSRPGNGRVSFKLDRVCFVWGLDDFLGVDIRLQRDYMAKVKTFSNTFFICYWVTPPATLGQYWLESYTKSSDRHFIFLLNLTRTWLQPQKFLIIYPISGTTISRSATSAVSGKFERIGNQCGKTALP